MTAAPPPGRRPPHPATVAVVAALLAFLPILWHPYAADSIPLLVQRPDLAKAGAIVDIFTPSRYNALTGQYSFRPLTSISFWIDAVLGARPWMSHAQQWLLHATNAFLVVHLVLRLGVARAAAALAGVVFAVHPVVSEAVNCAGFRADLLATLFLLAGSLASLDYGARGGRRHLALTALYLGLGLACKESAAAGILLFPAAVMIGGGRAARRRAAMALAAMGLVGVAFLPAWLTFHWSGARGYRLGDDGLWLGIANFLRTAWEIYLPLWLFPSRLRVFHEFRPSLSWRDPALEHAVMMVALWGALLAPCRRSPPALFGWFWVAASFGPVSQIVPIPDPVGERLLYQPHVGICLMLAGIAGLAPASWRKSMAPLAAVACLALLGRTWARHHDWRDNVALNIANYEGERHPSTFALQSLGALYLMKGDPDGAARALDALLLREPKNPEGLRLSALLELSRGDVKPAHELAMQALALAPSHPGTLRAAVACEAALSGPESSATLQLQERLRDVERTAPPQGFLGNRQ